MLPVLLQIGPLSLFSYGLMLALAFAVTLLLARRHAPAAGIDPELVSEIGLVCLITGVAGARLGYVLVHLDYYVAHPVEIFQLWKGGLIVYGGLCLATMSAATALYRKKIGIVSFADFLIVYVPLGQAIGRIGCFLNGCCFGHPTSVPWAVCFPQTSLPACRHGFPNHLHPVQLYEFVVLTAVYFLLRKVFKKKTFNGQVLSIYMIVYGLVRFCSEFFRGDGSWVFMNLSFAQLISVGTFFTGCVMLLLFSELKKRSKKTI